LRAKVEAVSHLGGRHQVGEVVVEVVEIAEVVVEEGNIDINISINWLRPSWGYSFNVMDFILICLIEKKLYSEQ
jgi:hypothetical protein